VSLMTTKQASQANGGSAQAAQEWARQAAQYLRARQLAAQAQLTPIAARGRVAARQGVYGARVWTAPRLDAMSQAMQEQVAPWLSAQLAAYARRIEPVPAKPPRRRWPAAFAAGIIVIGGSAAAVYVLNRRNSAPATETGEPGEAASSPGTPREMSAADAVAADVNGQTQAT
jgi:hypothetical protein